eukprot:TRINITY_DN21699_c0_g1_i1.p1 TRINITY_DN21699_c0_g1~~TRINITY_DN21699_c0_g1_i1.p1  ORF type:complete len:775 (+),score=128.08 TRINITY_DN21699_c0_g1_i1:98-2422(+)
MLRQVLILALLCSVYANTEINFEFDGMIPGESCCGDDHPVVCPPQNPEVPECPSNTPGWGVVDEFDSGKHSIFDALTEAEMNSLAEFMKGVDPFLDLEARTVGDYNYIVQMDPYIPEKSVIVDYLYGNGPKPAREAVVTVARGHTLDMQVYRIGPLPVNAATTATATVADGSMPFEIRGRDGIELNTLQPMVASSVATLRPVIDDLFNGVVLPFKSGSGPSLTFHATAPPGLEATDRLERIFLDLDIPGTGRQKDLHTIPIEWRVNASGNNPSTWEEYDFYYYRQGPYATAQALVDDYVAGNLVEAHFAPEHINEYMAWTREYRTGPKRAGSEKAPPRFYEPEGHRFKIHGNSVEWLGWKFHASSAQQRGPRLFDVTFDGHRIAFELAVNSLSLVYSCNDPVQGNVFYYDETFGKGETANPLPLDCPETSEYLYDSWWSPSSGSPKPNHGICIFEAYDGHPTWRRDDGSQSGLRHTSLHVRFPLPVGNYDYIEEFVLGQDGAIEMRYGATGNMQSAFMQFPQDPSRDMFADRVYRHSYGCLHDHSIGFKFDLDVDGPDNSFELVEYKSAPIEDVFGAGNVPPYMEYPSIKYLERTIIEDEADARFLKSVQNPTEWLIVNENSQNKWGNNRGYRVEFKSPLVADGLQNLDHPINRGDYRKYHIAVSQRHEDESGIHDPFALNRANNPGWRLNDFFADNENIRNEDLVAWVQFGFLHYPRAEDAPVQDTVFTGVRLAPFNFFDENPTLRLASSNVVDVDGTVLSTEPAGAPCVPNK